MRQSEPQSLSHWLRTQQGQRYPNSWHRLAAPHTRCTSHPLSDSSQQASRRAGKEPLDLGMPLCWRRQSALCRPTASEMIMKWVISNSFLSDHSGTLTSGFQNSSQETDVQEQPIFWGGRKGAQTKDWNAASLGISGTAALVREEWDKKNPQSKIQIG